jgi:hypothetical protein
MQRNYDLHKDHLADPKRALSLLYYDTLLHDPAALQFLLDLVGAETGDAGVGYAVPDWRSGTVGYSGWDHCFSGAKTGPCSAVLPATLFDL